jgi:serine/threonine-protein kinase RsbW
MAMNAAESGAGGVRRVTLRFPAVLSYRPIAIDLVSTLIQHVEGASRDFRNELITAFGEAFNNIAIHGYRDRLDGTLEIEAMLRRDCITLCLIDRGREVDFRDVEPPDLASMPESGMGIFLIHALVDEVEYRAGSPNVLSLTKRIVSSEKTR